MRRLLVATFMLWGCIDMHDPPPPPCEGAPGFQSALVRDPQTGQCESFGPTCDNSCLPCADTTGSAQPDWGTCNGMCEDLSETDCLAAPACHATYKDGNAPQFWGCWDLPPSGAIQGACVGLDAQTCSEHTDCISTYTGVDQGAAAFAACKDEPVLSCAVVHCDTNTECAVTPGAPTQAQCEPIATAGSCSGLVCQTPPPACPTGTTPGINSAGCYTGYCLGTNECAAALCSSLATESQCVARSDCDAIYSGTNCTCDKTGCTCQSETYVRCQ